MPNESENSIIFRSSGGHSHDGATSSLINTTKYSLFDFIPVKNATDTTRRSFQNRNEGLIKKFIVDTIEERVISPQGIDIKANAITAREIVSGTITSDKLTANLILVNNIIQSNNYTAGSTGWFISYDGSAEFSNVIIRGTIISNTGTIGGWTIDSNSIYSGTKGTNGTYTGAGNITISNTFISSNQFTIASNGLTTFKGTLSSPSGNIGGWTISSNTISSNGIVLDSSGQIRSTYSFATVTINNPDNAWPVVLTYSNDNSQAKVGPGGFVAQQNPDPTPGNYSLMYEDVVQTTGYMRIGTYLNSANTYLHLGTKSDLTICAKINQTNTLYATSGSGGGAVYVNSNNVLYNNSASSLKFKENIKPINIKYDQLMKINLCSFNFKSLYIDEENPQTQIGVIAEEIESLGLSEYLLYDENNEIFGFKYDQLYNSLLQVCQIQDQKIKELESRLKVLEDV